MPEIINCDRTNHLKASNPKQFTELLQATAELQDCRAQIRELREWEKDVVARVAELMPDRELAIKGIGHITRSVSSRNKWNDENVLNVISSIAKDNRLRKVDTETGEVLMVETESAAVRRLIEKCAKISYWRKTDLTEIGVDTDEYCETTWGKPSIRIQ
jgi:uncharacterized coiled-coil DUF342 family protein